MSENYFARMTGICSPTSPTAAQAPYIWPTWSSLNLLTLTHCTELKGHVTTAAF